MNWALDGRDWLRKRVHFEMPELSLESMQQLEDLASPVVAFVRDKCVIGINRRIEKAKLYLSYKSWCEEQGQKPSTQIVFGRNLCAAFSQVRPSHSSSARYYSGIELADESDD